MTTWRRCRCRFDPLWNSLVVGGLDHDGKPFLGTVGMIGTAYTDDHVATGAVVIFFHMHSEACFEAPDGTLNLCCLRRFWQLLGATSVPRAAHPGLERGGRHEAASGRSARTASQHTPALRLASYCCF